MVNIAVINCAEEKTAKWNFSNNHSRN